MPGQVQRYRKRISGPILDRIDLHIEVPRIKYEELAKDEVAEASEKVRARIEKARQVQGKRYLDGIISINSEMRPQDIKKYCQIDEPSNQLLKSAVNQFNLSARAYSRILKLARTIADLSGSGSIDQSHIAEALQYRPKENRY